MNGEDFALVEGVSMSNYGLESAISSTAEAAKDAEGLTLLILQDHLKKLCKMQRKQLDEDHKASQND